MPLRLKRIVPLLCSCALLLLASSSAASDQKRRALLIGIDGASMRIIEPLLAAGELPQLAAIARAGTSGIFQAPLPLDSPRIWNTVATGKRVSKHGILGFAKWDQGSRRLYLGSDRKVNAIWNIASRAGLKVGVVNFWNTYPPEVINGVMVSDHVLSSEIQGRSRISGVGRPEEGAIIFPVSWSKKLLPLLSSADRATSHDDPLADVSALPEWNRKSGQDLTRRSGEDDALTRIAVAIDQELRPELLMLLLPGIDRVSHHLWGSVEPAAAYPEKLRPTPSQRKAGVKILRDYYRYTDALLGALISRYEKEDLVLVLSDHGFEAGTPMRGITGMHASVDAAAGVFFVRGRGIKAGAKAGPLHAAEVTPTLLSWLGLAVAEDMDGAAAEFLAPSKVEPIATYETAPVERLESEVSGAESEIIEQLRRLGYVE